MGQHLQRGSTGSAGLIQVAEGSDAGSKCEWKWHGVPPWEIQHVCTNELIGQDLVEDETLGRRP